MKKILCWALLGAVSACGGTSVDNATLGHDGGTTGDDGGAAADGAVGAGPALARGLKVSVAVFQATKALIVKDGAMQATPNAPVIAGRPGILRVYVTPDSTWQPHEVTAELRLNAGGMDLPVQTKTLTISGPTDDAAMGSGFDFPFTADQMPPGTTFAVAIRDATVPSQVDDDTGAWFPTDGTLVDIAALDKTEVNIIFVPLKYDADGSGRVADASAAQIKLYNDTLYKMYPTSKVNITVHAPLPWSTVIGPDGSGWDTVLQAMVDLRQTESPPINTYYVATFEPARSIADFCGNGGCVLGIAPGGVGPGDVMDRMALTLGYTGSTGPDTLTQELAHALGRLHAPCGVQQAIDTKYPYAGAKLGVWGYNVLTKSWINPASAWKDFMSYCSPIWTSDYTYKAIASRLTFVNKSVHRDYVPPQGPAKYQWISVKPDGNLVPGRVMTLNTPPEGMSRAVTFHAADGRIVGNATGAYYGYGGHPGGFMFVPVAPKAATQIRVEGVAKAAAL